MSPRPIRLLDIAAEAGVSRTTVSMALNDHPRIPEATKERIRKISAELGYQVNPVARALRQTSVGRNTSAYLGTLALLESERGAQLGGQNPLTETWIGQLGSMCRAMGYRMDRFVVGSSKKEQQALGRILAARGIQGLIIHGFCEEIHEWALDWKRSAAVIYSGSPHEHFVHNVMSSSFQDVYDAIGGLYRRGYKRPGYFTIYEEWDYWAAGASSALDAWGSSERIPQLKLNAPLEDAKGSSQLLAWIRSHKPDVLVSNYGEEPLKVLSAAGIRVPKDIGYLCLDVFPSMQARISGLIQKRDAAFQVMVDLLHGMLMRHEFGSPANPFCIQIPSVWNNGKTLR